MSTIRRRIVMPSKTVKRDEAMECASFSEMSLIDSFNTRIRPMLDAIDKLRSLGIANEGIRLPTIVVVGDQSSGKSSVLESLSGVSLPKGKGIVTRVPLILRLQNSGITRVTIKYEAYKNHMEEIIDINRITEAVCKATDAIAGDRKGVKDDHITLTVDHPDLPDLTLVDLPGITRVPVADQPKDIHDQIATMIKKYIEPEESVILNVISAEVDFSTCESIAMSQAVDPLGERTLAVVTKADRAPDGLYEKVTANSVNVGLGYVCVRNRTENERSFREARAIEEAFFESHTELSKLDKSMLGVEALSKRLTEIQAVRITHALPKIQNQIKALLSEREQEQRSLPRGIKNEAEAFQILYEIEKRRREVIFGLLSGDNNLYPNALEMHMAARLDHRFSEFGRAIRCVGSNFLSKEYQKVCKDFMDESRGITLPNIFSHSIIHSLLSEEISKLGDILNQFVVDGRTYAQYVLMKVVEDCTIGYPKLTQFLRGLIIEILDAMEKENLAFTSRALKKELAVVYTNDPSYMDVVGKLHHRVHEMKNPPHYGQRVETTLNELGPINVNELLGNDKQETLDLQINIFSYWQIIVKRMADSLPMEVKYSLTEFLVDRADVAAMTIHGSGGTGRLLSLLTEDPRLMQRRSYLEKSINVLRKARRTIAQMFDGVSTFE